MKIVLATGIYPPAIGGPATYCRSLAAQLSKDHEVVVVTYGDKLENEKWKVKSVAKSLPIIRWFRYAKKLKEVGSDADVVYCFSSVSCGVPLWLSQLKKPKRVLRLGGDFFWERYTDRGGRLGLRAWYASRGLWLRLQKTVMAWLLNTFDHIVFSTVFQQEIYEAAYRQLPDHSVIANALESPGSLVAERPMRQPCRLLFMGRFVRFKNIEALIQAMLHINDAVLTIVGSGPLDDALRRLVEQLNLSARIRFVGPVQGDEKQEILTGHDILVIPSLTDISPNVALEARAAGLRVLLSQENGLGELAQHMWTCSVDSPEDIAAGITHVRMDESHAQVAITGHPWSEVASETLRLFATLCSR